MNITVRRNAYSHMVGMGCEDEGGKVERRT